MSKAEFLDPLIGRGHIVELGDLNVEVLDAGADRVERQPVDRGDRDGVVALVDPQEPDLELQPADRLVDVVAQPRIEHGVVVAAHLVRLFGGDRDVAHARIARDETAPYRHVQRRDAARGRG